MIHILEMFIILSEGGWYTWKWWPTIWIAHVARCGDSNTLDVEYMGLCQSRDHFELGGDGKLHEELSWVGLPAKFRKADKGRKGKGECSPESHVQKLSWKPGTVCTDQLSTCYELAIIIRLAECTVKVKFHPQKFMD